MSCALGAGAERLLSADRSLGFFGLTAPLVRQDRNYSRSGASLRHTQQRIVWHAS
jgi:hypothetical protein